MKNITGISVVILYFIVLLSIGAYASRKIKSAFDYLMTGENQGFY